MKPISSKDLVSVITKPFTSTKRNNMLQAKMLSNKICLVCHGMPKRDGVHPWDGHHDHPQMASIEEVKDEKGMGFLHGGL